MGSAPGQRQHTATTNNPNDTLTASLLANFFDGLRLITPRVGVDAAVGVTRTADLLKTIRIEKMVLH